MVARLRALDAVVDRALSRCTFRSALSDIGADQRTAAPADAGRRGSLATYVIGAAGLAGLLVGIPPPDWTLFFASIAAGIFVVAALVEALARVGNSAAVPAFAAGVLGFVGGVNAGAEAVAHHPWAAVAIVAATGALVAGLPALLLHLQWSASEGAQEEDTRSDEGGRSPRKYLTDAVGTTLATAYAAGLLVIAAWLLLEHTDRGQALATVNVAEGAFDVMVFALFRERFSRLVEDEATATASRPELRPLTYDEWERTLPKGDPRADDNALTADEPEPIPVDSRSEAPGAVTVITLFPLGFGILFALLAMVVAGAGPLGMNRGAEPGAPSDRVLLIGAVCAFAVVALAVAADILGRRRGPTTSEPSEEGGWPEVEIPPRPLAVALLAALVLAVAPFFDSGAAQNFEMFALIAAVFYAVMTWEALSASPLGVQLARPGFSTTVLILLTGLGVASTAWWLLRTGLWSGDGPATIGRAITATLIALIPAAALGIAVQRLIQWSGTGEVFTPAPPADNALVDHGQYVILFAIAAVVPVVAAAHIDAHDSPVTVVSSLVFLPGLLGAFLWVIDQNRHHHRLEQELELPRKPMWDRAERFRDDETAARDEAEQWLNEYKRAMDLHRRSQNFGAKAFLAAGMIALTVQAAGIS